MSEKRLLTKVAGAEYGAEIQSLGLGGIVRLLSGKEKPLAIIQRRKQMKMPTALHRVLG